MPSSSSVVQTYSITFPAATFPVPTVNPSSSVSSAASPPIIGAIQGYPNASDRWEANFSFSAGNSNALIATGDVVKSMVPTTGDSRLLAMNQVPASAFSPTPNYFSPTVFREHGYSTPSGAAFLGMVRGTLATGASYNSQRQPIVPAGVSGAQTANGAVGDWDNGITNGPDGPYVDRPDEGAAPVSGTSYQYAAINSTMVAGPTNFSPNRQVSSPVMFGSLPTGVVHQLPWQTLLFRPGPGAAGLTAHPGEAGMKVDGTSLAGAPPDYLLLDLFWMPVCQPYAISEPLATAGKVNLNYQIEPFTYITRSTALRSVLDSEKIAMVNTNQANAYKSSGLTSTIRYPIDLDNTLAQCDATFANGMIYESAAQICSLFLVPQQSTPYASANAFGKAWYQTGASAPFGLVGDNVKERPYAHIYSRITTKSNTYSVHYTVQALKNTSADPSTWTEGAGVVLGLYRGSTILAT